MSLEEDIEHNDSEIKLSDKDIFTKIWTSPRLVFKFLTEQQYDKYLYLLLALAGISSAFDRATSKNLGENMSLIGVVAFCVILGGLLGWISIYIGAALVSWTGKWLKGQGDTNSILRIMAYAMIPSIVAMILLVPQIALFGNELFQSEINIYNHGFLSAGIFWLTVSIEISLGVWTIVLFVIGISEVQKLSIGKSIINLILPALVILVPIAIIAFILGDLFR